MTDERNPFTDFDNYAEYQALKPEREAHKRFVQQALREAGQHHLAPQGFRAVGSSGREWIYDGGWWLCNVFFESGRSVSARLNVGCQYLWNAHSSPLEGSTFVMGWGSRDLATSVNLEVDRNSVLDKTDSIVRSAHHVVSELFCDTEDDRKHLALLAAAKRPGPKYWAGKRVDGEHWSIDAYNHATALGVTGDIETALEVLTAAAAVVRKPGQIPAPPTAEQLKPLRLAMTSTDAVRRYVDSVVLTSRQALKSLRAQPDTEQFPWH
ncbi:hypothetical protein AB0M22_45315 [Nocardia sp. NPDC051756]|uniref:hypothetical protein n=1 Tax=Nocardia sp. NPDC051756 TaxID=3154751 RepID=UPI0034237758